MQFVIEERGQLFREAAEGKGRAEVIVIRPGFNWDQSRYYPAEILARDHGVFEGARMYADHPTASEQRERPERSIRDLVGFLENVRVGKRGEIRGTVRVVAEWFKGLLEGLKKQGLLTQLGVSVNAGGTGRKGKIQGVMTGIVEAIDKCLSVDFVTQSGAGGMVELYESAHNGTGEERDEMSEKREQARALFQEARRIVRLQGMTEEEIDRVAARFVEGRDGIDLGLEEDVDKELAKQLERLGMSESAAKLVALRG